MRGCFAFFIASHARSIASASAWARAQIADPFTSSAIRRTASKSPCEATGKPASMTSTPSFSSCRAISSFSSILRVAPGACSPSRSVVSKMITRPPFTPLLPIKIYLLSQGIIALSFLPTSSISCSASWRREALKLGRPAWFSNIHSRAKVPS